MANEVSVTNQGDLLVTATLNRAIWLLTRDRVDLRETCWFADDPAGSGSDAVKIPQILWDEIMTAVGEGSSVTNSALGDGSATLTVARQAIGYDTTDLYQIVQGGAAKIAQLAEGGAEAGVRRASALIATACAGFSSTAGTSGSTITIDDVYTAQFALTNADVDDPVLFCVLKPQQFTKVQDSLRGEGGALQFTREAQDMIRYKSQGYKGSLNGIEFWTSARITDDSTDYFGAMYAKGAIAGVEAKPGELLGQLPSNPYLQLAAAGNSPMWVELERDAKAGETIVVVNYYCAFGENEDTLGVTIQTGM